MTTDSRSVGVIGAGPGGLSAAAALRARGISFEVLDAGRAPGGIWDIDRESTPMYESAHFISSRTLSGFPDFPMPESYPDYPSHAQVLEYIQAYARHHELEPHIRFGVTVEQALRRPDGGWTLQLSDGDERSYDAICVAVGSTWFPRMPEVPGGFTGESYHTFHYRSTDELRGKRVLVVGGGNSGADIACDAARTADRAFLSLRRGYHFIPKYTLGKPSDVFAHDGPALPNWLEEKVFAFLMNRIMVGDLTQYGLPKPDHSIMQSHPIVNTEIIHHLAHGRIGVKPDVAALEGRAVRFVDGSEEEVDLILWATGYEATYPFLDDAVLDWSSGAPDLWLSTFHRRYPDIFFMGGFETDGAIYGLFGAQASLIAEYLRLRADGADLTGFDALRAHDRPDLRGGRRYVDSPRHAHYVKGRAFEKALTRAAKQLRRN